MYCSKCGKEIKDEDKFCPYCGENSCSDIENYEVESNSVLIIDDNKSFKCNKKRKKKIILIIAALIIVIAAGTMIGVIYINSNCKNKNAEIRNYFLEYTSEYEVIENNEDGSVKISINAPDIIEIANETSSLFSITSYSEVYSKK